MPLPERSLQMLFTAASSVILARLCAVACCADGCRSQSWEKDLTWGDSIAISACEAGSQWVLALQLFEFMKATNDVCFWAENKASIAACPWLLSFMHCMNFSWSVRTFCTFKGTLIFASRFLGFSNWHSEDSLTRFSCRHERCRGSPKALGMFFEWCLGSNSVKTLKKMMSWISSWEDYLLNS